MASQNMGKTNDPFDDEQDIIEVHKMSNPPDLVIVKKPENLHYLMNSFKMNFGTMDAYHRNEYNYKTVEKLIKMRDLITEKCYSGKRIEFDCRKESLHNCSVLHIDVNGMEYNLVSASYAYTLVTTLYKFYEEDFNQLKEGLILEVFYVERALEAKQIYLKTKGFKNFETTKKTIYLNYSAMGSCFSTLVFHLLDITVCEITKVFCCAGRSLVWVARCRCIGYDLEAKYQSIKKMVMNHNYLHTPLIWDKTDLSPRVETREL